MSLRGFVQKLKQKSDLVDSSVQNIPVGGQGEGLSEVFAQFLNEYNSLFLAKLKPHQIVCASLLEAYNYADGEDDLDNFLDCLTRSLINYSVTENGWRAEQLCNIAIGQLNQQFIMDMQTARYNTKNPKLEGVQ